MHRLPKKLKDSIYSNTDKFSTGWGTHITESPNSHVIFIMMFLGLVGCVVDIVGDFMRDVQGAFGVGSYFATVQAAWMAAMYLFDIQEIT